MIKNIIFDFDGVIHNTTNLTYNITKQIWHPNMIIDEYKEIFMGNIYSENNFTEDEVINYFKIQKEEFKKLKIEEKIKNSIQQLYNSGIKLFIISSNTEEILNEYLSRNKIDKFFIKILGLETEKSKIKKFEMLFNGYNIDKEESIFITDTLGDIKEANHLNIKTYAITTGVHNKQILQKGNPYKIINKFEEILEIVKIKNLI